MSETYISASKLKAHYSWLGKDATLSPKDVDDIVDAQPAADVEPVVRGEWILKYSRSTVRASTTQAFCSVCGKRSGIGGTIKTQMKPYCPNCGAHMERSGSGE